MFKFAISCDVHKFIALAGYRRWFSPRDPLALAFVNSSYSAKVLRIRWFSAINASKILPKRTIPCCHFVRTKSRLLPAESATRLVSAFFVEDEEWANRIAKAVGCLEGTKQKQTYVFLANPGSSPLTNLILKCGNQKVFAWEPRELYWNSMKLLTHQHPHQFKYYRKSFHRVMSFRMHPSATPERNAAVPTQVKIVGNIPEMTSYVPKLIFDLEQNTGLWSIGDVDHYFIVSGLEYRLMTEAEYFWQRRSYQRTSIYGLFFKTDSLLTVPLSAFNRHASPVTKFIDYDQENMFLVKMSLRSDLEAVCQSEHLSGILRLLKAVNQRKGQRVIPHLERWCPDIGISLIELGISMMDRIRDVPLDMWPLIYKILVSSKHFEYSALKQILAGRERYLIQMDKMLEPGKATFKPDGVM